jgi:hypothetical protein
MASLKRQNQSAVFLQNPTTNPETLHMLQDPTLQNQSKTHLNQLKNIGGCIVSYNIGFITSN